MGNNVAPLQSAVRATLTAFGRWRKRFVHAWSVAVGRRAALSARDGVWEVLGLLRHNCDQVDAALARLDDLASRLERIEQTQTKAAGEAAWLRRRFIESVNEAATPLYDTILLTRTLAGLKILVDGRDFGSGAKLLSDGAVEPHIGRLLTKIIKPGGVFLDVGANYGYFTLLAASLGGPESRVYAFEANSVLTPLIKRSAFANGLSMRVNIFENAVSDRTGKALFGFDPLSPDGGSLKLAQSSNDIITVTEVNCARIDDLLDASVVVDCILLDVGGHEQSVMRGMERLLRRSPSVRLVFRYDPRLNDDELPAINMIDEMASLGLSVWRIDRAGHLESVTREELRGGHAMHLLAARRRPNDRNIRWDKSALQLLDDGVTKQGNWLALGPSLPLASGSYEIVVEGDVTGELELTAMREFGLPIASRRVTKSGQSLSINLNEDVRHFSFGLSAISKCASLDLDCVVLRES